MKKGILLIVLTLLITSSFFIYQGFTSKEKERNKKISNDLSETIIANNKIVTSKSGLYKEDNTYYFKGEVYNNYIKIFNRLYRIISIEEKQVKIVSNTNETTFYDNNSGDYLNSNIYNWLNKTEKENTGVYYNSIPNVENLLIPTKYCLNSYTNSKTNCLKIQHDYFSIINIDDYLKTGGKQGFLNNGTSSFLLGYNESNKLLNKEEGGQIKEASNKASGIRVVMTLKKKIKIKKGNGTFKNPYVIDQEQNQNDINKYVQLGDDLYQVIEDKDNVLKLRLMNYLKEKKYFNNKSSKFNPLNKNNIAYYLNNDYYESLPYKESLTECKFLTGELGENKDYFNIYTSTSSSKVGLLNMYDLNITTLLTDYYLINTSTNTSNNSYIYDKFGTIIEEPSNTLKNIVPVICLNKNLINQKGNGSKKNPYIID